MNAAVVGLLLAALFNPVWTSAIHEPKDFALGLVAFVALMFWKLPPWLVVGILEMEDVIKAYYERQGVGDLYEQQVPKK